MTETANGYSTEEPRSASAAERPADIEADMKEMSGRKRVDMIMNSQVFREELERIIDSQLNEGYLPASLSALQQVTELLMPRSAKSSMGGRVGQTMAIPVNDIRGVDGLRFAKGEKSLRCKLAAVYRLIDLYGWSQMIYNHISVRVSQDQEHFLINPFGLQYHEVTASSLKKVDMQGNVIDHGSTNFNINRAAYVLHSAIHTARPDIKAVIHLHHAPCVAVSAMKCGLLIGASQESAIVGDVSYHDFRGLVIDPSEKEEIGKNLGIRNKILILRNHGVVACGESIEEALYLLQNLVSACETQIKLAPVGLDNILLMSEETIAQVRAVIRGGGSAVQGKPTEDEEHKEGARGELKKWKIWDLEFECQMRTLDNSGYRTGYIYRQPLLRVDQQKIKYDVEIPPAASSLASYLEDDKWLSPLKKLVDGRKTQDKLKWVNSPNVYQRVEVTETGTPDPKKITKWVQDSSPTHASNPVKIESAHQFVPVNINPNEFVKKQKEMKQVRMDNKISGGPQSHILEGVTWEEMRDGQPVGQSVTDSGKVHEQTVMVGAASKGIIQREFQHNAMVYKSAYAKNPFDNVTDQELEDYRSYVEKKQRGEPVDDVPEHVKHLLIDPVAESSPADRSQLKSPQSPMSDGSKSVGREPQIVITPTTDGDGAVNGEDKHDLSGASRSSKEGSMAKDTSRSETESKKEKKKKGIRTPSFLKSKKKEKKKDKEAAQA